MIKISDLKIDPACLGKTMILADITPYYDYNSDSRDVIGYKYKAILPAIKMEALEVKIEGNKRLELKDGNYPMVAFEALDVKAYVIKGEAVITATAKGVSVVKEASN